MDCEVVHPLPHIPSFEIVGLCRPGAYQVPLRRGSDNSRPPLPQPRDCPSIQPVEDRPHPLRPQPRYFSLTHSDPSGLRLDLASSLVLFLTPSIETRSPFPIFLPYLFLGGQICLPFSGVPALKYLRAILDSIPRSWRKLRRLFPHHIFSMSNWALCSGLRPIRREDGGANWLYVCRGLGTHPPCRINCPFEVALIELTPVYATTGH